MDRYVRGEDVPMADVKTADIVTGPGGSQILIQDPSGNVVELFQPAGT